jgi:Circularly permutated YpsA SLOG family
LFPADKPARDRAALDWALAHGVECGGWCPKGRKAEDGPIVTKYPLKETPSAAYVQRTEWNVRDSDATVLLSIKPTLIGGSLKTVDFARKHQKPNLHLCARDKAAPDKLKAFVQDHGVKVLNVAGPRASKEPGVGEFVMRTLDEVFTDIGG